MSRVEAFRVKGFAIQGIVQCFAAGFIFCHALEKAGAIGMGGTVQMVCASLLLLIGSVSIVRAIQ